MLAAVAVVAVILAGLGFYYVAQTGDVRKGMGAPAAFLTVALASLALLRWGSPRWRGRFLHGLCLVVAVELMLQLAAAVVTIPRINTFEHVPFGRVYWTREGFANDAMNRYGWHAPAFELAPGDRRVVLIGDSFIQAVQVPADRNAAALLTHRLREQGAAIEVLGLGRSHIGPAHYLELVRYACARLDPDEVIIAFFLGNDFSDLEPGRRGNAPDRFLYWTLDADGVGLALPPASAPALRLFRNRLDFNHRPVLLSLPQILHSHYLTPRVLKAVSKALRGRDRRHEETPTDQGPRAELARVGLDASHFLQPPSDDVRATFRLAEAILSACRSEAARCGASLRLVTIPYFPPSFYSTQPVAGWTQKMGSYDLAAPDRRLVAFAEREGIEAISLAERMRADGYAPEQIRALYLLAGSGHFSEAGHAYLADALAGAGAGAVAGNPPPR